MEAVFLSKTDVYNGNYSITKRDATHEFSKEMHYHDFYEMQFYPVSYTHLHLIDNPAVKDTPVSVAGTGAASCTSHDTVLLDMHDLCFDPLFFKRPCHLTECGIGTSFFIWTPI